MGSGKHKHMRLEHLLRSWSNPVAQINVCGGVTSASGASLASGVAQIASDGCTDLWWEMWLWVFIVDWVWALIGVLFFFSFWVTIFRGGPREDPVNNKSPNMIFTTPGLALGNVALGFYC